MERNFVPPLQWGTHSILKTVLKAMKMQLWSHTHTHNVLIKTMIEKKTPHLSTHDAAICNTVQTPVTTINLRKNWTKLHYFHMSQISILCATLLKLANWWATSLPKVFCTFTLLLWPGLLWDHSDCTEPATVNSGTGLETASPCWCDPQTTTMKLEW